MTKWDRGRVRGAARGSTTKTLTLTSPDAGEYLRFQVTATDQEGQSNSTWVFSSGPVS